MHVKAKRIAFCGLGIAVTIVCMTLGGIIETNTLFFLAAASYLTGIVIRETGFKYAIAYYIAAILLGFFLVPGKFYVLSYAVMALYILLTEGIWVKIGNLPYKYQKKSFFWFCKFLIFNILYIPLLLGAQEILFGFQQKPLIFIGFILAGQLGLFIYDAAYEFVQHRIWPRIRSRIF